MSGCPPAPSPSEFIDQFDGGVTISEEVKILQMSLNKQPEIAAKAEKEPQYAPAAEISELSSMIWHVIGKPFSLSASRTASGSHLHLIRAFNVLTWLLELLLLEKNHKKKVSPQFVQVSNKAGITTSIHNQSKTKGGKLYKLSLIDHYSAILCKPG